MVEQSNCRHDEQKDTNIIGNITKLLPANTFLIFQILAPLSTNDGHCGKAEIIMTSAMLIILASTCMLVCFTDTLQYEGKVYHGIVTRTGLWNPNFKTDKVFAKLPTEREPLEATPEPLKATQKSETVEATPETVEATPETIGATQKSETIEATQKSETREATQKSETREATQKPESTEATQNTKKVLSAGKRKDQKSNSSVWNCFIHLLCGKGTCKVKEKSKPFLTESIYSSGDTQYEVHKTDFLNAVLSTMAFGALTMLTTPVTTCFYPKIPVTVLKTLPLLVGFVIGGIFAFSPPARNGIAHPKSPTEALPDSKDTNKSSQTPGKGNSDNKPPPDNDSGGSVKKLPGQSEFGPEHHQLPHEAAFEPSKDTHIPLALQEAAKWVSHDALVAGLVKAGAHPALAIAAVQDAKDAALTQMYHELQAATSKLLEGLSGKSFMALTRSNSMLQLRGSSFTPPSSYDVLFHETAQELQRQVSGLSPNVQAAESVAPQKVSPVQSSVTSLAQDTASGGSQSMSDSQYDVEQEIAQAGSQPAASVVIDIPSLPQRGSPMQRQLPRVTKEIIAQTSFRAPTASQVPLASTTHILHSDRHPDRQESTEILDSISREEITSESEAELSNRGDFRAGSSSSFNLPAPLKRKE